MVTTMRLDAPRQQAGLMTATAPGSSGLTTSTLNQLRTLIGQRGLTAQQAQTQYGLGQGDIDWLNAQGVNFASTSVNPEYMVSPGQMAENAWGAQTGSGVKHGDWNPGGPGRPNTQFTQFRDQWRANNPDYVNAWSNRDSAVLSGGLMDAGVPTGTTTGATTGTTAPPTAAGGLMGATGTTTGGTAGTQTAGSGATTPGATGTTGTTGTLTNQIGSAWHTALSSGDYIGVQNLINQGNMTEAQARASYGLDDAAVNFIKSKGITFATVPGSTTGGTTTVGGTTTPGSTGTATTIDPGSTYTPTATGGTTGTTTLPGTTGLIDAITVPGAAQAAGGNINAASVQQAGDVTAGTGTAGNYSATTANAAAPVVAGTAQQSTWTPGADATVQGQLANITAQDSALNQLARTQGLQEANRRGLMNSSMAVEAAQTAVLRNALPIAQQDASTFAQAGQFNAAAAMDISKFNVQSALQAGIVTAEQANQMAALNAEFANRASEFNITSAADMAKFNIDNALKAGIINQEQANRMNQFVAAEANKVAMFELQNDTDVQKFNASESNALTKLGMDSQTKLALAQTEAAYKTLMQTSAGAAEVYKTLVTQMASILSNKDMDGAAKTAAIQNLTATLNASLGVMGAIANMDLPELDLTNLPGATTGTTTGTGATTGTGTGATDTSPPGGI